MEDTSLPVKANNQITTILFTICSQRSRQYRTKLSPIFPSVAMSSKCLVCLLTVFCLALVSCKTIYLEMSPPTDEETAFLKKYGYLREFKVPGSDAGYSLNDISEALKKMQAFAGLLETGMLDAETKQLFKKRRCGVRDIEPKNTHAARRRRYVLQQGWTKRSISYRVKNGSSTLDKARVEELIAEGLAVWAPHGKLQFHKKEGEGRADIEVSFAAGSHGDGFPFDGPGRVVAHAFPPPHGAMHFDDDEIWGDNPEEDDDDVTDFFAVAVHEIGHALGMAHSNVKTSVMYPYYQVPIERLYTDDILGMQELYLNEKQEEEEKPEEITESPTVSRSSLVPGFTMPNSEDADENYIPDLCMANYDTLQVLQGKIFVFEEEWVWVLRDKHKIEEGYPKLFHDVFRGLPADVTMIKTIYEKQNGNIVIFSEHNLFEFDPSFQIIRSGFISEYQIPDDVSELTSVFVSNYNNKTYLLEEERFWRFDETNMTMDAGYPKDMSAWRNVPYPVNAAIVWKGDTFFFQGPRYWRFDNTLVEAHRYYPLPTAPIWFKCEATPEMTRYITNDGP
ncbi:unnamed protein product [Arctia plantaginis]|uniref:Peptidase metallopeptidase domain-containing protein n=1 Tax=Arctia plantaginis TaxID=874455 RepID=A0A8S0ZPC3_ARCPL|nr:unnamed protein product [Arctia plantaginis]